MKLAIIGGGNMGSVLARNMLQEGLIDCSELLIVENSLERRMGVMHRFRCQVNDVIDPSLTDYPHWMIAVKPQAAEQVCAQLSRVATDSTQVISVMAGVPVSWLSQRLGSVKDIARAIPNLPARVGQGTTVYYAPADCSLDFIELVEKLFSASGKTVRITDESLVDAATALFSSGPGFIFYLFESFVRAAVELGYSPEQAEELMTETFAGAASLLRDTKIPAAMWKERVATKGGTTEAGLRSFDEDGVDEKIVCGIRKAFERSIALGKRQSEE